MNYFVSVKFYIPKWLNHAYPFIHLSTSFLDDQLSNHHLVRPAMSLLGSNVFSPLLTVCGQSLYCAPSVLHTTHSFLLQQFFARKLLVDFFLSLICPLHGCFSNVAGVSLKLVTHLFPSIFLCYYKSSCSYWLSMYLLLIG